MFENIIGNDKIKKGLETAIKNNTVTHSYLFTGISGIGKKMIAIEFAKRILCLTKNELCTCKSCIEFEGNNNPDFFLLEADGNSIKIEQIRALQKKIQEKPIVSNKKVYIINDADKMTKEAQNCLLKTLEEPPEFATIILIGENENSFLQTIKSRCMIIHFVPIEDNQIIEYMKQNYDTIFDKNSIDIFQGSIGKAISLKDKQQEYKNIQNMIEALNQKDLIEVLKLAEPLYKAKEEIFEILEYINILLLKLSRQNQFYTNCVKIVENTKKRLSQNANYDMCIDNLLFNMWEEFN